MKRYIGTFVGRNGSMGLKYGRVYVFEVAKDRMRILTQYAPPGVWNGWCPYTLGGFLANWQEVRVFVGDKEAE